MIPNLQPYPKYKDSGVEWLGKVPEEWEVLPNRTLFQEIKDSNHPEEPLISVTISKGIIKQSDLIDNTSKKDSSNEDKTKYKLVKPGDIAYNKMRAWQGAIGISDLRGIVSPAYIIQRPRRKLQNGYFHYLLRTPLFAKEAERWSYGITSDQWSLRSEHFKMIYCSLPPIEEQSAIVRYLNYTNNRIQQYITSKHKLVKLLEEQKLAIIHQAVTGAIDVTTGKPYPKYKDSGVEWLGTVPEGWEVRRIKSLTSVRRGASPRPIADLKYFDDLGEYAWVRISDVSASSRYLEKTEERLSPLGKSLSVPLDPGSIFLSIAGSVGKPIITHIKCCIHDGFVYFPQYAGDVEYLYYILVSGSPYSGLGKLGTQLNLNTETVGSIRIGWPSAQVQESIVLYLDAKTKYINNIIDKAKCEIELLKEYRVRLTADVVTGKADVREVAKNLPAVVTDSAVDDPNNDDIENTQMLDEIIEE